MMRVNWNLTGELGGEAVAWAIRILVDELRRNEQLEGDHRTLEQRKEDLA